MKINKLVLCMIASFAILLSQAALPLFAQTSKSGMGMNTYKNDWYFVNMMKVGSFFQYSTTPIAFDTNGWPTTDCGISFVFSGHYGVTGITGLVQPNVSGTYYLQFQCASSSVVVSNQGTSGNSFTITNQSYNSGTQTWSGDLVFTATTGFISPSFVGTNGGIRNVVFLQPGYPSNTTQIISTDFATMMAPFGAFRPLSDQGNGTYSYPAVRQWAGRANNPNAPSVQAGTDGSFLAWEWQILLANYANSDLWVCVPINATDDYVSQLASLIRNGDIVDGVSYPALNSNLHVYVEYSNEVWNLSFFQFFYAYPAARAEINAGNPTFPMYLPGANYFNGTGTSASGQLYYAEHVKHVSDIFRSVWGNSNMMTRVRPVVMWQAGQIGQDAINDLVEQWDGPGSQYFYGCGVATYFNPSASTSDTEPELITATEADVAGWNSNGFPIMRTVASEHGENMDSYEGGTGVSLNNPMTQAEYSQCYDTQMATITDTYYTDWFANGGDVTNWLGLQGTETPSSGGAYGMIEDPANPSGSPRWNGAVTASAASRPSVTAGVAIASSGTTSFNGATYPDCPEGIDPRTVSVDSNGNSYVSIGNNSATERTYLINVPSASNYSISLNATTSTSGVQVLFTVDGVAVAQPGVPTTGMYPWTATSPFVINLAAGPHSIRVTANNNTGVKWYYENFNVTVGGTLTTNQKPTVATTFGSFGENGQNSVAWTAAANNGSAVTSYNLYRSTSSGNEGTTAYKTGIDALNFMDTSLTNGTTYFYKVTAVNVNGEGPQSAEMSSAPTTKPGAPTNLIATAGSGSVTLTWTAPTGRVDLYNIYRSFTVGNEPVSPYDVNTVAGSSTSYTDSNNINNSVYHYTITAVNLAGEGSVSNDAAVTLNNTTTANPDIMPYDFRGNYISYAPLTVTMADATSGATIYYTTDNSTPTTSSPVYSGPIILNGSAEVNAIAVASGLTNSGQTGNYYNVYPPVAPSGLTAAAGSGQVTLNWSSDPGATSYVIRQSTSNGGPYTTVGTSSSTSFTNTGLSGGTTYYYVVLATGNSGQSGESYQASAVPTGGSGVLFSDNFEEDTVGGQATGWTVLYGTWQIIHPSGETQEYTSEGNSYTSAGSSSWTNYNISTQFNATTSSGTRILLRLLDDNDMYDLEISYNNGWSIRKCVGGTFTTLSSGSLTYSNNTDYYVKFDANGSTLTAYWSTNGGASYSTLGTATDTTYTSGKIGLGSFLGETEFDNVVVTSDGGGSAPSAPTGLTATGGNATVALAWTGSTGATSYNVYRGTTSGGESGTAIATGITTVNYTDNAVVNASTYYYEVKAVNSSGTSGYSNEANAPTDLFADNFEEDTVGGQASGWTVLYGTWQIVHPSGETQEYTSEGNSYTSAGSSSWTNYYVETMFNASGIGTRLMGRLTDDNDFYDVEMANNTGWSIRKNVAGSFTTLSSGSYSYSNGTDYYLKLDMNGSTITAYISANGGGTWTTLGSATDTTYTSGKMGFGSYQGTTEFDNVTVGQP